jgi:hypothetical protein
MVTVRVGFASFLDWWEPFTLGVGPAGAYAAALGAQQRDAVKARCEELLPPAPFQIEAAAWVALGHA